MMLPLLPSLPDPKDIIRVDLRENYPCHEIIPSKKYEIEDGCGLIPIHTPQRYIETEGLKWDMQGDLTKLEFGKFISTSNKRVRD